MEALFFGESKKSGICVKGKSCRWDYLPKSNIRFITKPTSTSAENIIGSPKMRYDFSAFFNIDHFDKIAITKLGSSWLNAGS